MKRLIPLFLAILLLAGCARRERVFDSRRNAKPLRPSMEETVPAISLPPETEPVETEPPAPEHSALYIPGVPVEDVILYFNEVCLDSEYVVSGDPSLVQKWDAPIRYTLEGSYTEADLATLSAFTDWLNAMEGFPGISETQDTTLRSLRICFCTEEELIGHLGDNFYNTDGGVTFWYSNNVIYEAIICIRTDLDQTLRNSVILEELYNGLGPVQDTLLRPDSLIAQAYGQPQWLTPMDELILKLLYHPDIRPGMNAQECAQVIGQLYY